MSGNKLLARKLRIINYKQKCEHWYLKRVCYYLLLCGIDFQTFDY